MLTPENNDQGLITTVFIDYITRNKSDQSNFF